MKETNHLQCICGFIHESENSTYTCRDCGKQICEECCGFDASLCDICSDIKLDELDKWDGSS